MNRFCVIWIFFFLVLSARAQEKDTLITEPVKRQDVENLRVKASKNKFTKWLHGITFKKPVRTVNQTNVQAIDPKKIDYDYEKYQGKIIRNIKLEILDPFGYSVTDSTKVPTKYLDKLGNRFHMKTKEFTLKSMLLFKKNQLLDSMKLKESERLVRSRGFVRRITIKPLSVGEQSDSVDVYIRMIDSWSIYPTGSISTSSMRLKLVTNNFAGFGHYMSHEYRTRYKDDLHSIQSQYQVNNIAQTYVNAGVYYNNDYLDNYNKMVYVQRAFYSPLARWAGGITATQSLQKDSLPNTDNVYSLQKFKSNYFDFWGGYSIPILEKIQQQKVITNLILSARYYVRNYLESPNEEYDPNDYYSNQQMFLVSAGLSSINFMQDRFIFHYDRVEDIAVGKIFSITGGIHRRNQNNRLYLGTRLSMGKYTQRGYIGGEIQWGSFFNNQHLEESVFRMQAIYFTRVFNLGKWKFRQFINPELVYGYNRLDFNHDKISLNGANGINGFNSYHLKGTKKMVCNIQLQSYAPATWLGFRFSPFARISMGMLGDEKESLLKSELYSSFGLGVMVSNNYMNAVNLQLSLSFYPHIPGQGNNIIKTNNLRNYSFDLQNFFYGSPSTVPYR